MSKHRIIGLIVLIALAIMTGQFCLNYYQSSRHHLQTYRSAPVAPLNQSKLNADNAPKVETTRSLIESNLDVIPETVPAVSAWIVQMAILSNQVSAQKLLQQLKALGFEAFIATCTLQGKSAYRVALGPFTQQQLALDALMTAQEKLKMTGILKQYTIGSEDENEFSAI